MIFRYFDRTWTTSIERLGLTDRDAVPHELGHLRPFRSFEHAGPEGVGQLLTRSVSVSSKLSRVAVADDVFRPGLVAVARVKQTTTQRHVASCQSETATREVYIGRLPRPLFADAWFATDRIPTLHHPLATKLYDHANDWGMAPNRVDHEVLDAYYAVEDGLDSGALLDREPVIASILWALREMPHPSPERPDLQAEMEALLATEGLIKQSLAVGVVGDLVCLVRPCHTPSVHEDACAVVQQICDRFPG